MLVAVGSGYMTDLQEAKRLVKVESTYTPRNEYKKVYDKNYEVFKILYAANKKYFRMLNGKKGEKA